MKFAKGKYDYGVRLRYRRRVRRSPIWCSVCRRMYLSVTPFEETRQGDRCAASPRAIDGQVYLWCHYGSNLDGNVYRVDGAIAGQLRNPVCDDCIENFERQYFLTKVADDAFVEWPMGLGRE